MLYIYIEGKKILWGRVEEEGRGLVCLEEGRGGWRWEDGLFLDYLLRD